MSNKEIQNKMIESIDTMLLRNEYGVSGFILDFATECGNAAIFPEFFKGFNGDRVEKDFFLCPYNKEVLLGTKEKFPKIDKEYCEENCCRKIFEKDANLRREILERFKNNLQSGYYLDCLENNKPIKPLLTDYERAIFKAFWEEYEEYTMKVDLKDRATKKNFKDNLKYFDGTTEKPIAKELFEFWAKYVPEHKLEIERFKRGSGIPITVISSWASVDGEYNEKEEIYEHFSYTPQTWEEEISRTDCRIKMSLFDCVELGKPLFYFGMNFNGFVIPATEELIEFYNKWENKGHTNNPTRFVINIGGLEI